MPDPGSVRIGKNRPVTRRPLVETNEKNPLYGAGSPPATPSGQEDKPESEYHETKARFVKKRPKVGGPNSYAKGMRGANYRRGSKNMSFILTSLAIRAPNHFAIPRLDSRIVERGPDCSHGERQQGEIHYVGGRTARARPRRRVKYGEFAMGN